MSIPIVTESLSASLAQIDTDAVLDCFFDGWFVYKSYGTTKKFISQLTSPSDAKPGLNTVKIDQSKETSLLQLGVSSLLGLMIIVKRAAKYGFRVAQYTVLSSIIEMTKCIVILWRIIPLLNLHSKVEVLSLTAEERHIEVEGINHYKNKIFLRIFRQCSSLLYAGIRLAGLITGVTVASSIMQIFFYIGLITSIYEGIFLPVPANINETLQHLQMLTFENSDTRLLD